MTGRSRFLVAVLAVLAVAMAATGAVLLVRAHQLGSASAADNRAVVDRGATREVEDQVSTALTRILTFDHNDPDATKDAAQLVLTGTAEKEYDELFATLLQQAGSQELTLTSSVAKIGVMDLDDSSARLLVFVDQSSTRGVDDKSSVAAAQLVVTAVRRDGRWAIDGLDPI